MHLANLALIPSTHMVYEPDQEWVLRAELGVTPEHGLQTKQNKIVFACQDGAT